MVRLLGWPDRAACIPGALVLAGEFCGSSARDNLVLLMMAHEAVGAGKVPARIVTVGTQGDCPCAPSYAGLWGFARSMRQELTFPLNCIDVVEVDGEQVLLSNSESSEMESLLRGHLPRLSVLYVERSAAWTVTATTESASLPVMFSLIM